jgi:alkyl hydroperoxide reductase subunit F
LHDVVVVGAGPAGMAAAHVCQHWGLDTLLVSEYLGGRTNFHLKLPFLESDDFSGGSGLALLLRERLKLADWPRVVGRVDRIDETADGVRVQGMGFAPVDAHLAILCTGARPERLDVPGEHEFIMRGVAYSTGWYAPLFSGRTVAVVGSGARAYQGARHLAAFARQIYLIQPEAVGRPPKDVQAILQTPSVSLMAGWQVGSIEGNTYVERIRLERENGERVLDVDGVFVCAGITHNTSSVAHMVELASSGAVKVDGTQRTSHRRLMAAGDVTDAISEQVLVALGQGARAGLSAWETRLADGAHVKSARKQGPWQRPTHPKGLAENGH